MLRVKGHIWLYFELAQNVIKELKFTQENDLSKGPLIHEKDSECLAS